VKTVLVDMTKLHLVEITRKRMKKPLYEVFSLDGKVSKQVREETIE
jgi:Ribonuclease G/E